jgi:hypothetical protein
VKGDDWPKLACDLNWKQDARRNNIDQSYVYVDNFWEKCCCLILILVKKAEKRKANDEPTDPETPRNKDLKYDREKQTRTFQNSWIDKFPWQDVYYRS